MGSVASCVSHSVAKVTSHSVFQSWLQGEDWSEGDWAVLNNSFVHRDLSTSKSPKHLMLKYSKRGRLEDLQVVAGMNIKADFRRFGSRVPNLPGPMPIKEALRSEMANLGHIVYTLIGRVGADSVLEQEFVQNGFARIVWDPTQKVPLHLNGQSVCIKDPFDEEALWGLFESQCRGLGVTTSSDTVKQAFGTALDRLQGRAEATLHLPSKSGRLQDGITDSIVAVLSAQRQSYSDAFAKCKGSPDLNAEAYNQILRIAYNFASDAIPYLRLIVSICDLKPILLWMTIGQHFLLSEAFRNLPWARSKYKASLGNYTAIIGDARNAAFHNVFPFRKALKFELPADAIKGAELRIFSEYSPRSNSNTFSFQDKEVVDILLSFRRAKQRPIPAGFWEKNTAVMDALIELFANTSAALKVLYRA